MGKEHSKGGRKSLTDQDPDWREKFCSAYVKYRNPKKAADSVGFNFGTIMGYLHEGGSSFDKDFKRMFDMAQLEVASDLEEFALNAAYTINDPDIDPETAKIMDIKSRITLNTLGKINPARFGKRLEMNVTGKIDHSHSIQGQAATLTSLMEMQRERLLGSGQTLPLALPEPQEAILEAQYVEVGPSKPKAE